MRIANTVSAVSGSVADWTTAFSQKSNTVFAAAGHLALGHFGRIPSRLAVMDAADIGMMPIADFIRAYALPADVESRIVAACQAAAGRQLCAASGPALPYSVVPASARTLDTVASSAAKSWRFLPPGARAAAAALLTLLIS